MRHALMLASACLAAATSLAAARPLDVRVPNGHRALRHEVRRTRIANYLVYHGLLTPQQAACASLVPGPHGSRRVSQLKVFETYGGRCPGVPQPPTFLFDVYVDNVSGAVDTTRDEPDELQTVL